MQTVVKEIDGEMWVIIPQDVAAELGWKEGDETYCIVENDAIIVKKYPEHEPLEDFAIRVAELTGYDDKPQSREWIVRKAKVIAEVAKSFCHYKNGGSMTNSCCNTGYRCRKAAEAGAMIKYGDRSPIKE